jgi:acetolactate synthase-1/2/3 large subunit
MKGAEAALSDAGVDTFFANPGTSEIDIVAAFDRVPGLRVVPTLFELVATGAADGYGRLLRRPAATLLHLAPGLAHGLGNLHNARRAHSPVINVLGQYPRFHRKYEPPLDADLEGMARLVSGWVATCEDPEQMADDRRRAVRVALEPPGQVVSVLVTCEACWSECDRPASVPASRPARRCVEPRGVESIAEVIASGERFALLVDGSAALEAPLRSAARIAAQFGAPLYHGTFCSRLACGAGLPNMTRFPFHPDDGHAALKGVRHLILVEAEAPVAFFPQPGSRACSPRKAASSISWLEPTMTPAAPWRISRMR